MRMCSDATPIMNMGKECKVGKLCRTCDEKDYRIERMYEKGMLQTLLVDRAIFGSLYTSERVPVICCVLERIRECIDNG